MMTYAEGSVAEWSARWTRNSAVPGSSLALATCWICSSATLVNSQLHGCLLPVGVLNSVMLHLNYLFPSI